MSGYRPSLNGPPLGDEEIAEVESAAEEFFSAVSEGDGDRMWEVMSDEARQFVLNIAMEQGLDFDLASRLRQGTASEEERATYLDNLVSGIRRDLQGVDLDSLSFEMRREPEMPGQIRVTYLVEVGAGTERPEKIPAGSLVMVQEEGRWRLLRLVPRPG